MKKKQRQENWSPPPMDIGTGKLTDVLIVESTASASMIAVGLASITVYADPNLEDVMLAVEGVSSGYALAKCKGQYEIWLDPRYDREWVKNAIEAAIKLNTD